MTNIRYFADHMAENKLTEFEGEYIAPAIQEIDNFKIPDSFEKVLEQNYQALLIEKKCLADAEIAKNKEEGYEPDPDDYLRTQRYESCQKILKSFKKFENKQARLDVIKRINDIFTRHSGMDKFRKYELELVTHQDILFKLPEYTIQHAISLSDCVYSHGISWYGLKPLLNQAITESVELRQLINIFNTKGCENTELAIAKSYIFRDMDYVSQPIFAKAWQIAPFFLENLDFIAEALTLLPCQFEQPNYYHFDTIKAITLMHHFPGIPSEFMPKLLEFALTNNKTNRPHAQKLLARIPNIHKEAITRLSDAKQDVRVVAIDWLAELALTDNKPNENTKEIINTLQAQKKIEKKVIVQARLISALEKLGEDVTKFMTPVVLLKEAEKGLKVKRVKHFEWFRDDSTPELIWQDGSEVDSKIIRWWIVLAEKLKEPKPNALFKRYLNLLDETSQQSLSLFVLQTFARQDLSLYSKTEAIDIADTLAPQLHSDLGYYECFFSDGYGIYDSWSKQYPDTPLVSVEIIHTHVVEQLQKTIKSSAIKSKGMLALVHKAVGTSAVDILTNYIKNHHRRTAQIGALLDAFSASDDPLVIQWILNISRRYRTKSIQEKAMEIIAEIAKRNHWTPAQLGDRTIPMAGVDDDGILQLDYGTRTLTAYIDEKYKFVLQNEQGKVIKSLPAPRQEDDKKLIKETKSLFSACKKELKQMIELQTARLYEAMCCERLWAVDEWQEYLLAHPIMKRLIARLIWIEVNADGTILQVFRPSEDGSLLNISDDEISLNPDSQIKLAHHVLLAATSHDVKQWKQHLKDYEIKPLFEQLKNTVPQTNDDENSFTEFVDTPSEAFKLRSVVTKMGYLRCGIGDGGGFDKYYKYYESLDISAVLVFSGSGVPEENINIQLGEFRFQKGRVHTWDRDGIDFDDVPPILLAESYAEYGLIAKKV